MGRYEDLTGLSLEECRDRLLKQIQPVTGKKQVNLKDAAGLVMAEDLTASFAVPPFAKSAMDGYAVRAEETVNASPSEPVVLSVSGKVLAGEAKDFPYKRNSAVRIMTGGRIPQGFDAVIRQEDTDFSDPQKEGFVSVYSSVKKGGNICEKGEELSEGSLVIEKGRRLGRTELGLLASLGADKVYVKEPIKIAILSTGSELAPFGEELPPGKIYGSIAPMLSFSISGYGFSTVLSEVAADEEKALAKAICKAVNAADILITTGGVSVGEKDLVPWVLEGLGAEILFTGADVKPGTPTTGSVLRGRPVLSLSGNPYAALANFDYYFPYLAAKYMDCKEFLPVVREAEFVSEYPKVRKQRQLVRARYEGGKAALAEGSGKASVIGNMRYSNCYLDIAAGTSLTAGDMVTVRLFR